MIDSEMSLLIEQELAQSENVLSDFRHQSDNIRHISNMGDAMIKTLLSGGKIIACGNGGSYCDAMHFAEELSGRYRKNRQGLAAIAASDGAHITCCANDFGYDQIYARFVESVGNAGDLLLLFSSSGKSKNLINAAVQAHKQDIQVASLTGKDGGELTDCSDYEVRIEHFGWADRIQEMHIKIVHILLHYIERGMNLDE